MTNVELEKIELEIKSAIEEAVKYASESPYPGSEEATTDLFA